MNYSRYSIYYTAEGDFADAGASWLGWDVATGKVTPQPDVSDLDLAKMTETPRRYGFHATLKPPMRLASGQTAEGLEQALHEFAATHSAAKAEGLELTRMGRWLALTIKGDTSAVNTLAAEIVRAFDPFRAPAPEAELARRRARGLTAQQEANLTQWGYPYVMDAFRFHMTLSAPSPDVAALEPHAATQFAAPLKAPFSLDSLTLAGEDDNGFFHEVTRVRLQTA